MVHFGGSLCWFPLLVHFCGSLEGFPLVVPFGGLVVPFVTSFVAPAKVCLVQAPDGFAGGSLERNRWPADTTHVCWRVMTGHNQQIIKA